MMMMCVLLILFSFPHMKHHHQDQLTKYQPHYMVYILEPIIYYSKDPFDIRKKMKLKGVVKVKAVRIVNQAVMLYIREIVW